MAEHHFLAWACFLVCGFHGFRDSTLADARQDRDCRSKMMTEINWGQEETCD